MTDFREQIRQLLRRKDIGIWATATRAKIHPKSLYDYLSGKSEMRANNVEKVMSVLQSLPDAHSIWPEDD